MASRKASIWWHHHPVGEIRDDDHGLIRFAYAPEWLDNPEAFPISISLPLSRADEPGPAHGFFAGLLPEGATRQRICRQVQVDPADDMGLLLAIGEDCAGALSILPTGQRPRTGSAPAQPLDDDAIAQLVRGQGRTLPGIPDQPQRFSLAGAQDKFTIGWSAGAWYLPDRDHPSTHILKFETIPRVCLAEFMANRMAGRMGLPVVHTEYRSLENSREPYLCVERYDRDRDGSGELRRLHQEDVLQALGEPASVKYQAQGGPSLAEIGDLIRKNIAQPAMGINALRDWQIFNYLCGNWDGHAKNIALLYPPGEPVPALAPFYDLVAIEFLNRLAPGSYARDMALYIGEHAEPERISKADWTLFARHLGIPPKPLFTRLEEMANQLPGFTRECLDAFPGEPPDAGIQQAFEEAIRRRCHWVLNSVLR